MPDEVMEASKILRVLLWWYFTVQTLLKQDHKNERKE
jgi:hypothetical protein